MKEMQDLIIWWDQIEEDARQQAADQVPPPCSFESANLNLLQPKKVADTLQRLMDSFRLESYRDPIKSRFCHNGGKLIKILDISPQRAEDAIHHLNPTLLISVAFSYKYIAIAPPGSETELTAEQAQKLNAAWDFDKTYAEILHSI